MNFTTNKEKGNAALGMAIAYFAANGYIVSIPLNDTQDYDLVVDRNDRMERIQVKSSGCKTKYGITQVALKSCGGTNGKTYKTVVDTNIDKIFIVNELGEMYLLPKSEIKNRCTLNLNENLDIYKVKI